MYMVRAGAADEGAAGDEVPLGMRVPHDPQKAKPGFTGWPQLGHVSPPAGGAGAGAADMAVTGGGAENEGSGAFPPCEITPAADVRGPGAGEETGGGAAVAATGGGVIGPA
jgi:hypothetical protein